MQGRLAYSVNYTPTAGHIISQNAYAVKHNPNTYFKTLRALE